MIDPGQIPQYTGDFDKLSQAVGVLRTRAIGIRNSGQDVHSRFQATAAYYQAPEADQLFSSTQPVMDTADEFAAQIESLADALDTYIAEAKPHADRLKELREKAIAFVDSVQGDDDWNTDQAKHDEHEALMDGVAEAVAGFWAAERSAADKISGINPAMCRPAGGGSGIQPVSADTLKSMRDLPWGSREERAYERWSLGWWGHGVKSWVWDGIVKDSLWGGFVGLGALAANVLGINGSQAQHDTWEGLRRTIVGAYAYGMDAAGMGDHLSDWQRGSETYAKEFSKQFIAYDMWEEDPARAHAVTSFNLLTLFAGGAGALAKVGKAGRFTEVASTVAKVGDALDPVAGTARAAGALSNLPKVSEILSGVSEHLKLPKSHFPDTVLDLDNRYRVDANGNFIALHPNGTPDLTPPPREHAAADRLPSVHVGERELAGVGSRATEPIGQRGDHLASDMGHGSGGEGSRQTRVLPDGEGRGVQADHPDRAGLGADEAPSHGLNAHGDSTVHESTDSTATSHAEVQGSDSQAARDADDMHDGVLTGIDPARYEVMTGEYSQSHTGPIKPEQEAGVLEELKHVKMEDRDRESVIRSLRKDPYGAGVAELINRGHLRGAENYKDILDMCKKGPTKKDPKGSMVPAAYMALRLATELQDRGVTHLGFELGDSSTKYDIDVYTRNSDGAIDYGYQLKDVDSVSGIRKAASKSAAQMDYPMSHRVAILDVHESLDNLPPRIFEGVAHLAQRSEVTYLLRFEDGAITVPSGNPVYP